MVCVLVAQSRPAFCDPMYCSTAGFSVLHHLPQLAQTPVYWAGDAIQPSHPLLSSSSPAFYISKHLGPFQWVGSLHQMAKVLELPIANNQNCAPQQEKHDHPHISAIPSRLHLTVSIRSTWRRRTLLKRPILAELSPCLVRSTPMLPARQGRKVGVCQGLPKDRVKASPCPGCIVASRGSTPDLAARFY